jgi:polysaccharide biosynthesis protein PslH
MKITLVCFDIPYPAIHGGRVDVWRRLKAFSQLGVELQLVCWVNSTPSSEDIFQIKQYVADVYLIYYETSLFSKLNQIHNLLKFPLEVISRRLNDCKFKSLREQVSTFNPDIIWLDGIHGGEIALKLGETLNKPILYRSHNIEYLYYQRLFSSATGLSKIRRFLSKNHMERYEKNILRRSTLFYDISPDDLKFWKSQGFNNSRYLPPLAEFYESDILHEENHNIEYDIVFLGNLYSNNNVAGITWFITEVVPKVRLKLPNAKILIAGAKPVEKIKKLCQQQEYLYLHMNPVSATKIYRSGRIFVNPVLTGSGVSIKSVEMLVFGKPIVSTSQGIAGLPEVLTQYFHIANDSQSFADQIIQTLCHSQNMNTDFVLLKSLFGTQMIEKVITDIKSFTEVRESQAQLIP